MTVEDFCVSDFMRQLYLTNTRRQLRVNQRFLVDTDRRKSSIGGMMEVCDRFLACE